MEVGYLVVFERRVTQEVVEVGEQGTGASLNRHLTQIVVEVGEQVHRESRVTQEVIEVAEQATGVSLNRHMTQIVVEVGYVFPVQPFGEQEGPREPEWSPAYIQPPVESEACIYGPFGGLRGMRVWLGKAPGYIQLDRQ